MVTVAVGAFAIIKQCCAFAQLHVCFVFFEMLVSSFLKKLTMLSFKIFFGPF